MKYNNKWVKAARQHKDASRLTPEQQTALFVTNILDKTLLDDTGQKLIGEGDKLVKGILKMIKAVWLKPMKDFIMLILKDLKD